MLTRQVLFMIFAFIVSFAFTFATTPLVRRFAFKIGAIDIPKDNRRMHKKPTPRIGGLAIIFGFTVATLCFAQPSRQLYGTLAGAAIIAVMGVIDDCKNLPAKLKFVIQIIAALVVVFAGDIKIDVFTNPNFLSDNPYWVLPEWLSVDVYKRQAFKAVGDSKQVAYLCPTTILAMQHYETFLKRMESFPIKVEMLSRFRTASEQKRILKKLKTGEIDIIIGTHRILSKDLEFKDLGLLIIDEEQRFGVAHKERLKKLKQNIDVLTMTATPIPRTLHMAMTGVRDMSVLCLLYTSRCV